MEALEFGSAFHSHQATQVAVITSAIGTQCALGWPVTSGSQTYEGCSGWHSLQFNDRGASCPKRLPALKGPTVKQHPNSEDGAHASSCGPNSCGCSGSFTNGSHGIQLGRKLSSRQLFNRQAGHVRVNVGGDVNFICPLCNRAYRSKHGLSSHMRAHSGEKPFACNVCQKRFTEKASMVKHGRLHSGEKPYVCDVCPKSFTFRCSLVNHKRQHSGEKPYACGMCQERFINKGTLVNHEKQHSGERPFVCGVCLKKFTQRGHLLTHEILHSGEKPYVCQLCPKAYARKVDLVRHEKSHRGEKPHL